MVVNVHHAVDCITEAFMIATEELDGLISRRFAAKTIRLEELPDGRWTAVLDDTEAIFPACPHRDTIERFMAAFARKEGYRVEAPLLLEHSVRVPDNVVAIR